MAFRTSSIAAGFAAFTAQTQSMMSGNVFQFWGSSSSKEKKEEQPSAKKEEATPTPPTVLALSFKGGVCLRPHDDKVYKGGEDAYTASPQLIAMADGVGGWARKGVDPGLFSKQLTKDIQAIFNEHRQTKTLKEILIEAVQMNKNMGSSTAVLASLEEPNVMKTCNLGDSGYVIYQASLATKAEGTPESKGDDQIVLTKTFRSESQQHRFNFPYQCGTGCELPTTAFDNEHTVSPGKDFVIMGTDGLFDNLYDPDIEACLKPNVVVGKKAAEVTEQVFDLVNPEETANCMAKKAYALSKDRSYVSPFADEAMKCGKRYVGGKEDDITVIVSQIIRK